ncbi:MAG: hypothetical protein WCI61_01470 [Chloroflexota bacterium]
MNQIVMPTANQFAVVRVSGIQKTRLARKIEMTIGTALPRRSAQWDCASTSGVGTVSGIPLVEGGTEVRTGWLAGRAVVIRKALFGFSSDADGVS